MLVSGLRHVSHVRSKAASKRERPWYRPCSTYLTEYRILMRHDAASPAFRRASGRKRGTDNVGVPVAVGRDLGFVELAAVSEDERRHAADPVVVALDEALHADRPGPVRVADHRRLQGELPKRSI